MKRREFIAIAGTAAAWPLVAHAQQPAMPIIGFLTILSSRYIASRMPSFRQGLKEAGYIEGQNVAIEHRLAEGHYDQLPEMLADLIGRQVALIVTSGIDPSKMAKAATTTLPIVFITDVDPVTAGLVASLNRPGGNITAISLLGSALEGKRLGLLNEIVSGTAPIGVLLDSRFPDASSCGMCPSSPGMGRGDAVAQVGGSVRELRHRRGHLLRGGGIAGGDGVQLGDVLLNLAYRGLLLVHGH